MKLALIHAGVAGIGGFPGFLARYGVAVRVARFGGSPGYSYGTLVLNLLGR